MEFLLRQEEADQEEEQADRRDHEHRVLPAGRRSISAERLAKGLPAEERDETATVGEEHAVGAEHRLGVRIVSHHAQHRPIRDVDAGIDRHHQDVGHVGPDQLHRRGGIRRGEEQDAAQGEGHRHQQQVGTVFAPAGAGAVRQDAHHRVADGVPDAGHDQQQGHLVQPQAKDIAVKERQVIGEYLPEHRGRHVPEAVTHLFREGCPYLAHRISVV